MSPSEVARAFGVRSPGMRKNWRVKCPSHRSHGLTLSITDMGNGKTRIVCFAGCDQSDVLKTVGLTWRDLRPLGKIAPVIRWRLTLEDQKESLERQLGLAMMLQAVERAKRTYWAGAERRIRGELEQVRCRLEPEKVMQEYRERTFRERVRKHGFTRMWEEYGET